MPSSHLFVGSLIEGGEKIEELSRNVDHTITLYEVMPSTKMNAYDYIFGINQGMLLCGQHLTPWLTYACTILSRWGLVSFLSHAETLSERGCMEIRSLFGLKHTGIHTHDAHQT